MSPQNPYLQKYGNTDIRPAFRAHLVTVWLVFGGYLLWAILFRSPHYLTHLFAFGTLLGFALALFFLPLLLLSGGFYIVVFHLEKQDYRIALAYTAAIIVYFLLWRGIWYVMYGKKQNGIV